LKSSDGPPLVFERFERTQAATADLAAYAGDYYSEELRATYKVAVSEGRLTIQIGWNEPRAAEMTVRDEFRYSGGGGVLAFTRAEDARIIGMRLFAGRVRDISFVRK